MDNQTILKFHTKSYIQAYMVESTSIILFSILNVVILVVQCRLGINITYLLCDLAEHELLTGNRGCDGPTKENK